MNYVFMSPHFPPNYKNFAIRLKNEGVNVLGIGSEEYDSLDNDLKDALSEYYKVDDMEDYNQMLKACGYFVFKYGKIDRLESHNEHWLEQDAKLRTDFNISGYKTVDIYNVKEKSQMKKVFKKVGLKVAQGKVIKDLKQAQKFVKSVGYPVIAKPDCGVGAADTYKIRTDEDLLTFFNEKPDYNYIMEEFIEGEIHTYDGITDMDGNILLESSMIFTDGVMETVSGALDIFFHVERDIPDDLREAGQKVVEGFKVRERFFHIEFFRTPKGDLVPLEINARPPGGFAIDIMNVAFEKDFYTHYAQIVVGKKPELISGAPYYCGYVGIHTDDFIKRKYTLDELNEKYKDMVVFRRYNPQVFTGAMGDYFYALKSEKYDTMYEAAKVIMKRED